MWDSQRLRDTFLSFFKEKGHTVVPSSSLIPEKDPTLLFTSAGMVQFKPLWKGEVKLPYKRATSCQKCLRLSDIDRVGETIRHDTFFEMLGNFSFGDYFKREAIEWAWEFLTDVLGIPGEKFMISVYPEDEETYSIWRDVIGIPPERIVKLEDNFWGPAGGSGPCGPDTEIHYDMGEEFGDCTPVDEECDRFIELWNLVFPQFNQVGDERLPLENRGVDTGMGLERLAMVMQGKKNIFETDLFLPIIQTASDIIGIKYQEHKRPLHIISDHIRALTFAISDGAYPSNEGRGYILRRILRRALLQAHKLGVDEPVLYRLVPSVVDIMKGQYPELKETINRVSLIIKAEEERFLKTIDRGLSILEGYLEEIKEEKVLDGTKVFTLYDTYGFPPDLVENIISERGFSIDWEGFEREMERQRERAREKSVFRAKNAGDWVVLKEGESRFTGYDLMEQETEILAYRETDDGIEVILEETPFYAESGGQVGDTGVIEGDGFRIEVKDTQKGETGNVHIGRLEGEIGQGTVFASVDKKRRMNIMRNHTATHLLHRALRMALGEHVKQEGSLVAPDRLRFDFSHPSSLNDEEIARINEIVNQVILEERNVFAKVMPYEEAISSGAIAFFGEKYGDTVRVIEVEGFSKELCGGTHVNNTASILGFRIVSEKGIAAGIRRIEAITGEAFIKDAIYLNDTLSTISEILKTKEPIKRVQELQNTVKELQKNVKSLEQQIVKEMIVKLQSSFEEMKGIKYMVEEVNLGKDAVRKIADTLRQKNPDSCGILGIPEKGSIFLVAFSGEKVIDRVKAPDLLRAISQYVKGGGGGRPHLAEGGGRNPDGFKEVKKVFGEILQKIIKG